MSCKYQCNLGLDTRVKKIVQQVGTVLYCQLYFRVGRKQREGMGLLEYRAMPSLRVLCTFSNRSAQISPRPGQKVHVVSPGGGMDRPSQTKSHRFGPALQPSASLVVNKSCKLGRESMKKAAELTREPRLSLHYDSHKIRMSISFL